MKALLAESNKQDQQLVVPKGNKGGKGKTEMKISKVTPHIPPIL
jgi:hypothetical protein